MSRAASTSRKPSIRAGTFAGAGVGAAVGATCAGRDAAIAAAMDVMMDETPFGYDVRLVVELVDVEHSTAQTTKTRKAANASNGVFGDCHVRIAW